jgi:DNA-binding NtrC family response regulator
MLDVLLADDDAQCRARVADVLGRAGHHVTEVFDGAEAMRVLATQVFDLVLIDLRMPRVDGMTLFRHVHRQSPGVSVVLMSGHATLAEAVGAIREGASDFLLKPFAVEALLQAVERVAERRALDKELQQARTQLIAADGLSGSDTLIGRSPVMVKLRSRIDTIAQSEAPVLITGESGTGKELVARVLHQRSSRRDKPLVVVNCAALPETLIEAELFGHEKGAFTDAIKKRDGRFKHADGGTLLLDEVAELPLPAQAKLLRVLQEGTVEPLGSNTSIRVDVRIISATHRNLKTRIAEGSFREDLFYRLKVLDLHLPPLRQRPGDLSLLLEYFLRRFAPDVRSRPGITPSAWERLAAYPFPGNLREFAHAIERAVVLARGGTIDLEHLPEEIVGASIDSVPLDADFRTLAEATRAFERDYLLRALALVGGKRTRAAELLGISRKNLWEKLKALGIAASEADDLSGPSLIEGNGR